MNYMNNPNSEKKIYIPIELKLKNLKGVSGFESEEFLDFSNSLFGFSVTRRCCE